MQSAKGVCTIVLSLDSGLDEWCRRAADLQIEGISRAGQDRKGIWPSRLFRFQSKQIPKRRAGLPHIYHDNALCRKIVPFPDVKSYIVSLGMGRE